jgi:hypothetical protein
MFDLLGQATADNAFRDFSTIDDLFALPAIPGKLRRIHWKDEILSQYVLRNSEDGPLSVPLYNRYIRRYADEEGYGRLTSYAIRRYVSNRLVSKWLDLICVSEANHGVEHVPVTVLSQTMGHADHGVTFGKHYRDKLAPVDIQGILMDDEQDIDWAQYMRPEQVQDLPGNLPLSTIREIEDQVSLVEGVQERYRFRKKLRDEALARLNRISPFNSL